MDCCAGEASLSRIGLSTRVNLHCLDSSLQLLSKEFVVHTVCKAVVEAFLKGGNLLNLEMVTCFTTHKKGGCIFHAHPDCHGKLSMIGSVLVPFLGTVMTLHLFSVNSCCYFTVGVPSFLSLNMWRDMLVQEHTQK